jgi:phosphoglycolate phosphatase
MFKNDKKLIIFDLDGTLIDSGPDLALSINYMLKKLDKEPFEQDLIHQWVGNGASTLVKRALSGSKDIDSFVEDDKFKNALEIFLDYYAKNLCVETVMYANVEKTLGELKSLGFKMAIVTNKPYDFVGPILKELGIDMYFEYYVGGDSLKLKKPNSAPLLHVCKNLSLHVEQSLMVGDSKNDILAAKAANMECVGVSYGYNYGENIAKYEPDFVVDNIYEIVEMLKR